MDLKESNLLGDGIARHWYYRAKAAAVQRLLRGRAPAAILDVGAGSGFFSRHLLTHTSANLAWCVDTGYDSDSQEEHQGKTLYFQRELSPVPADLILLMDVLEHVDDDAALLRAALAASTATDARILISVPAFQWLWSGHDDFLGHQRRYRLRQLTNLVTSAGLVIEQACYYYGLLFPLAVATRLPARIQSRQPRSQLRAQGPLTNRLLLACCHAELPLLAHNRLAGLSAFCLARAGRG
ncbi:methyltransferase domain-containing protein [Thiorhodovibrio winogradskyi]|nr:methyltransferase domain-containing protein [Thiorhodovibrio winogradskyi]